MDSLIAAAARALAQGDTLGALGHIALRDDPPALALRGIAMARMGNHAYARELLKCAARGFGAREALARARCIVADAELALAMRDLAAPSSLAGAIAVLDAMGDTVNAAWARLVGTRRALLLGRLDEARAQLAHLDGLPLPHAMAAVAQLAAADLALRSLRTTPARQALEQARHAALRSRIPSLVAEVDALAATLVQPAARLVRDGERQPLRLDEVERLLDGGDLVLDGCRRGIRCGDAWLPLARRPVLFTLARVLAEASPGQVDRDALIRRAFRMRVVDETHRARLRVEIGRLRALCRPWTNIEAGRHGFRLVPHDGRRVRVLEPPLDGDRASLLALLSDGEAWSSSSLALALGLSQRSVQRALAELEAAGEVRSIGHARARRWLSPRDGFATALLLPAPPASG